jgi:hypothetical protein
MRLVLFIILKYSSEVINILLWAFLNKYERNRYYVGPDMIIRIPSIVIKMWLD